MWPFMQDVFHDFCRWFGVRRSALLHLDGAKWETSASTSTADSFGWVRRTRRFEIRQSAQHSAALHLGDCKTKIPEFVREFVCIRLACFDQPSQVRQLVRENFDLDLSPQSIEHYDPYRYAGKELAKKFVCLFHDARKRYLENVADVALAQKTHRLKWLERLAAEAERMGDITGAAEIIEKASKDSTDY
jgi:hypothetical protein